MPKKRICRVTSSTKYELLLVFCFVVVVLFHSPFVSVLVIGPPGMRVVKGGGGGSRSRFTENKTVLSQFTKNKIGISRFTEKKGERFFLNKSYIRLYTF